MKSIRKTTVFLTLFFVAIILFILLVAILVLLYIFKLLGKIGRWIQPGRYIERAVHAIFDEKKMYELRDDFMLILLSEVEPEPVLDRWGLIREIEIAREDATDRLKEGENAISIGGTIVSIIVGFVLGLQIASLVIGLTGLMFTVLVVFRTIISDMLSYKATECETLPVDELLLRRGWNRGVIGGEGGVSIAILSIFANSSERGYHIGIGLLEQFAVERYDSESDLWYIK